MSFFGRLDTVLDNVLELDSNKIAVTIYKDKDIQRIILSKNRIDQLTKGLDSDGEIIGVYSPITFALARLQGNSFTFDGQSYQKLVGQPYNFVDTGDFLSSFVVNVYADGFSISADDQKEDENLTDKYGQNILGLTDESKSDLVKSMIPIFQEVTRKSIFK